MTKVMQLVQKTKVSALFFAFYAHLYGFNLIYLQS